MVKTYVEITFELANGTTRKLTVKDVKQDVKDSELIALANLFVTKNSQFKGSEFAKVTKCFKYDVEETKII